MKKRLAYWLIAFSLPLFLQASPAIGAVDMFLKLDGIDGESRATGHEKWIEILSYSWGLSNSGTFAGGSGGGAGKASFQDFHFAKELDASSPKLFQYAASGNHIAKGIFEVVRIDGQGTTEPFLTYELTDLLVSSYQVSSGGDIPTESFSLNFSKISMEYTPIDAKSGKPGAPIHASWDIKMNSPAPEPSTWAMLVAGLAIVAWRGRRMLQGRAS